MLTVIFVRLINLMPLRLALGFCSFVSTLRGESVSFKIKDGMLISYSSYGRVHYSGTPRRGLEYLTNGLKRRGEMLRQQYLLDLLGFHPKTVVDVGANSGDFLLALSSDLKNYLGIEPIDEEHSALNQNCEIRGLSKPLNLAASDKTGYIEMYVSTEHGDSSPITPARGYSEIREVRATRLDDLLSNQSFKSSETIDLLKIEAEGYEPEILQGSANLLKICRWVVVDGGPERGLESETTIERCVNILSKNNFKLVAVNLRTRPGVGLFKNESME